MPVPLNDPRTRKELLEEIERRAPFYTPEWRYNPEEPDAGTALAFIWADMLAGALERYNRVLDNYRRALLHAVGAEPQPPLPGQGYLCFMPLEESGAVTVPAGTGAASPDDVEAVLLSERELAVSSAKITGLYYTDPQRDICKRYAAPENITLFEAAASSEHIWTFTHPYAFDVSPGKLLRLEFAGCTAGDGNVAGGVSAATATVAAALTGSGARRQFERGGEWLDFLSAEAAGTTGTAEAAGVADAVGTAILLRFPDEPGGACTSLRFCLSGETTGGLTLAGLCAYPSGNDLLPEALYAGDTQLLNTGFYPFGQRFIPYNCFYLSCREALAKPGATVELSFDLRMEEIAIEGYQQPEIIWKRVMRAEELQPPEEYEVTIADTAWEYYNGTGWASLPLESAEARAIFAGGQQTPARYLLRFTCPADMEPVVCGAHDALFIRARILSVDNLFRSNGHYLTPWLARPRFRYYYREGVKIETAVIDENLDRREVSLATPAALAGRVSAKPAVCLAFDRPFATGTLLFLLDSHTDAPELRWEYYTDAGWTTLDIHDETANLGQTGLVTYLAPMPAAKLRLMGQEAWWMRLVDAAGGYGDAERFRPLLRQIFENAVPARARVPGAGANLPAGSYRTLSAPIAGIAAVFNPLPVRGGCGEEEEERTIRRLTAAFSHGGRAVSRADTESLAMEASLQVLRCRCFPGTDRYGMPSPGDSCLVVLRAGGGAGDEEFTLLQERIGSYLAERRPPAFGAPERLYIREPRYIAVNVTLSGSVAGIEAVLTLKKNILETLTRYLDPITGGADGAGWEIGTLPSPSQLIAALRGIEGLLYIQSLDVTYTRLTENGATIKNYSAAAADRFVLPQSGRHEIRLFR